MAPHTQNRVLTGVFGMLAPHIPCYTLPPLVVAFSHSVMTMGEMSTLVTIGSAVASAAGVGVWWALCGRSCNGWKEPVFALALAAGSFGASQALNAQHIGHHSAYAVSEDSRTWFKTLTEADRNRLRDYAETHQIPLPQAINDLHILSGAMCVNGTGERPTDQQPVLFIP